MSTTRSSAEIQIGDGEGGPVPVNAEAVAAAASPHVRSTAANVYDYDIRTDDDIMSSASTGAGDIMALTAGCGTDGNNDNYNRLINIIPSTSTSTSGHGVTEITEIIEEEIHSNRFFSNEIINNMGLSDHSSSHHLVYVAVGKGETSMDALLWTLTHHVIPPPTTIVYLVHIFSDLKFFPSPLGGGRVPKSQVNPELAQTYLAEDRSKRRELLSKYMDKCTAHLVQVETILIESDSVAKAITELISVLNIPKLIVGISKSNLRKLKEGKGKGGEIVANEILQRAPAECEVKIICQGKDVSDFKGQEPSSPITNTPKSNSPTSMLPSTTTTTMKKGAEDDNKLRHHPSDSTSFSCCFKPSF